MRWRYCIVLAVLGYGCSPLPPIDPGICGNRVLEPEEDCDTFSGSGPNTSCGPPETPNACFFVCDAEGVLVCPSGWRCGLDGRCRRPRAEFSSQPSVFSFPVESFDIGDVDGDRNNDLIGFTRSSIAVRFGERGGDLEELLRVGIHRAQNDLHITEIDGDGRLDVVVPVSSGLFVLRGRPERRLAPVAYSPFDLGGAVDARIIPLESRAANPTTELLTLLESTMFFEQGRLAQLMPLGKSISDVLGRIPVADLDRGADRRMEFALTFAEAGRVFVYTSTNSGPLGPLQVVLRQQVRLPRPAAGRSEFADLNGDGFVDLLTAVRDAGAIALAVAHGDPRRPGMFVDQACLLTLTVRGVGGSEPLPMPLALGDVNMDGKADFIVPRGVAISTLGAVPACGSVATPQILVAVATRGDWSDAAVGDFNRDRLLDVAGVVTDTPDVDVLLGSGVGLFNPFHVRTAGPPVLPRVGDFDGDQVGDLAFSQAGGEVDEDELFVVFGSTEGGPSEPISMGRLGRIEHIEPLTVLSDQDTLDLITDLLVTSGSFPDAETHSVALLYGNSERRLLAPFFLRGEARFDVPYAAVAGNFCRHCPGGGDCEDATDLVSVARSRTLVAAGTVRARGWIVPGDPSGGPAALSAELAVSGDYPGSPGFDVTCARFLAGDLDGDGYDELIGYDGVFGCAAPSRRAASQLAITRLALPQSRCGGDADTSLMPLSGSFLTASDGDLIDLDADGDLDVVIGFNGDPLQARTGQTRLGAGVVVVWNEGGRLSVDSITTIESEAPVRAVGAILSDADEIPELLMLTTVVRRDGSRQQGLFSATLEAGARTYTQPVLLTDQAGGDDMAVGDLDGDGIEDIAWSGEEVVKVIYAVPGRREGAEP